MGIGQQSGATMQAQFEVIGVFETLDELTDAVSREETFYKMVFGPLTKVFSNSEFVYAKELGVTTFSARKAGGEYYEHINQQAMQDFILFVALSSFKAK